MKQGKRLTRDMKIKLANMNMNLNPKNWQYIKSTSEELVLLNKASRKVRVIKQ